MRLTDADEIKLKPCPFCGGEAKIMKDSVYEDNPYFVICTDKKCECYAVTNHCRTPYSAIKAWNRRVHDDSN